VITPLLDWIAGHSALPSGQFNFRKKLSENDQKWKIPSFHIFKVLLLDINLCRTGISDIYSNQRGQYIILLTKNKKFRLT
jgi:hypothetical protein